MSERGDAAGDDARARLRRQLRRAKDDATRDAILDSAERVFAENGFEGARMQEVAAEASVSSSTVYGLFDGKDALFAAVHERRGRELLRVVGSHPASRGAPLPRLLGGVAAYTRYLMEHPTYLRLLGHAKVWTEARTLPSESQVSTAMRGNSLVARAFEEGIESGVFRRDHPDLLARLMHATHQVRLLDWLERGMAEDPSRVVEVLEREVICMFCVPDAIERLLAEHGLSEP